MIHGGSCWKIQGRRQINNTDNTLIKYNPQKANTQNTAEQNYLV